MSNNDTSKDAPARGQDVILDHNYDGIQEYDNPMPEWYLIIFWACIIWGVVYAIGITAGWLPTYEDDLEGSLAELATIRRVHEDANPAPKITAEFLATAIADDNAKVVGAGVYTAKCAACHGDKGQGLIGPNLTDNFWIHGGSHVEIHTAIAKGVPAKGMPPWEGAVSPDELVGVVAHIVTLQGTKPDGAKEPQGTPYKP